LLPLIGSPAQLIDCVNGIVGQQREALNLPPLERPAFQ
jgi:hypothetical protein